jgi:hypothetical protein
MTPAIKTTASALWQQSVRFIPFLFIGLAVLLFIWSWITPDQVVITTPDEPAVETVVVETPAAPAVDVDVDTEGFFTFVGEGNFWLAMTIILAIILVANLLSHLKKPVAADAAAGTLPAPYFRSSVVWFIAAALMVLVGLWGIYPAFFGENNQVSEIFGDLGLFGIIAVGVISITLVVGTVKYMGIAGNASAYFFMVVWILLLFFGIIYLLGGWLAPDATTAIIEAVKNDAQSAAAGIVETTNGIHSIKWEKFVEINWGKFFGISFFGLCVIGVGVYLLKGNKIVTFAFVVVASLLVFPTAFYYSWTYAVPGDVKEFVTGAATSVYEANPVLGETKRVQVALADVGRNIPVFLGPHDELSMSIPMGGYKACADASSSWKMNHGHQPWFDPHAFASFSGQSVNKRLTLSKTLTDGMRQSGVSGIDLMVSAIPAHDVCPTM